MVGLTFLRHGRSRADDENVFESRYDSELTEVGCRQATDLAQRWKLDDKRRYDVVVTSPLKRAVATAAILADAYKAPVVENELLLEIDAGELCGMDKKEGIRKYPPPQFANPYDRIVMGSGESEAQLHARALLAIESILNMKKSSYLVVSHGMILNAILRSMFGIPIPVNRNGTMSQHIDGRCSGSATFRI
jgi:broad specificity phosphatase PhoE